MKKRVLIIRLSSIGDIVLTTPVIRCLKKQTDFEIHYLTKPEYADVLMHNPFIDVLHTLDQPLLQKALSLNNLGFYAIIDLHNNLRTAILKSIIKSNIKQSFNKLNVEKFWAVTFKQKSVLPNIHITKRYLAAAEVLGIKNDALGLDYFTDKADDAFVFTIKNLADKYAVWAIGAQHATKKLPKEKIVKTLQQISNGFQIVLIGDKYDTETGDEIAGLVQTKNILNLCGKLTINQSAAVTKFALFAIANDTGFMHIAAAFKKPVISIWGNTIKEFGMQPYYGELLIKQQIIEVNHLKCRPCSKIGFKACPKKHFKCMNQHNESEIAAYINTFAQYKQAYL